MSATPSSVMVSEFDAVFSWIKLIFVYDLRPPFQMSALMSTKIHYTHCDEAPMLATCEYSVVFVGFFFSVPRVFFSRQLSQ